MGKLAVGISVVVAVLLVAIGASLLGVFPTLIRYRVGKQMSTSLNADALKRWLIPPVPIYMTCYYFNLTNVEEFKDGAKPQFEEVGPYVYREERIKTVSAFDDDNGRLSYREKKSFTFLRDMSVGKETDKIFTVNVPVVIISAILPADAFNQFFKFFANTGLVSKYSVRQLLFGTYKIAKDPSLETSLRSRGNFALLSEEEESYVMNTGSKVVSQLNTILSRKNQKENMWNDTYCDMINGTDGSQMPPDVHKDEKLYIYIADFCRSLYLTYQRDATVLGIDGYRFTVPDEVFESPEKELSNKCYCPYEVGCDKKGILPLEKCKHGAPIYISSPHFLNGDESLLEAVEGLKPDVAKHETYLVTEPLTGTMLNVHRRIQINLRMVPKPEIEPLAKVNETIFPLLWLDENAVIDEKAADMFKEQVYSPQKTAKIILGALITVGIVLFVITVVVAYRKKKKNNDPSTIQFN